jgi:hypothetical protein
VQRSLTIHLRYKPDESQHAYRGLRVRYALAERRHVRRRSTLID